jgi:hypothetical protein
MDESYWRTAARARPRVNSLNSGRYLSVRPARLVAVCPISFYAYLQLHPLSVVSQSPPSLSRIARALFIWLTLNSGGRGSPQGNHLQCTLVREGSETPTMPRITSILTLSRIPPGRCEVRRESDHDVQASRHRGQHWAATESAYNHTSNAGLSERLK